MTNNDIIDNRSVYFVNEIKKFLKNTKTAKFASGYFYLNGFDLVKGDLQDVDSLRILMGDETTRPTKEELVRGYEERKNKKDFIKQMSDDIGKLSEEEQIKNLISPQF